MRWLLWAESHAWCACRGYVNTSAVKSAISFIDGDKGILRYRGYPIEQLAERSNFTEVRSISASDLMPS
jgi:citrate synthase